MVDASRGMSHTYGQELRFIVFDIEIDDMFLDVPDMAQISELLELEVVPYREISTDLEEIDAERDRPSEVAERRGCGTDKKREGVVLRPPFEVRLNNGERVMAKHKRDEFGERATPQKVVDPSKLQVLEEATAVAQEWVTEMRLIHILQKMGEVDITAMPRVISAMVEDIEREGTGEIKLGDDGKMTKEQKGAVGKRTAQLFKAHLQSALHKKD